MILLQKLFKKRSHKTGEKLQRCTGAQVQWCRSLLQGTLGSGLMVLRKPAVAFSGAGMIFVKKKYCSQL